MSENPLKQGLYSTITQQGIIASSSYLDTDLIREFQENAENPSISAQCVAGGTNEINYDCLQGDLIFGLKNCRNSDIADAEDKEMGIVSVPGFHWGKYCSQQEAEDQFYFIGVALTEQRLTSPLDSNTYDPDHGMAHAVAGGLSVINTGPRPFYPGNLVAWKIPDLPYHPKSKDAVFRGGQTINPMARGGNPATKFTFEIVPFDYSDFSVQFAGSFAAFQETRDNNGISDIPYEWTLCNNEHGAKRNFSNIQDQALSFKFGLLGSSLRVIEALIRRGYLSIGNGVGTTDLDARNSAAGLAERIGLFETNANPANDSVIMEALSDVFMMNISNGDPLRNAAETRFGGTDLILETAMSVPANTAEAKYDRLRLHALDQLVQGIALAWHSKTEKILGRAFNCAATSDTLDVCFGHYAL